MNLWYSISVCDFVLILVQFYLSRIAPKAGKIPARIRIPAPVAMVYRLITLVMASRPTFWLKEVMGIQPKQADKELIRPSQARLPEISLSVDSRPRTVLVMAEVSPMVSVAETRKIMVTETIALRLNTGL